MPKLKAPLLSFNARGRLGKLFSLAKRQGRNIIERKPIPVDAKSPAQLIWRQIYRDAVAAWHALSKEEQQAWRGVCAGLTAYQCFMSSQLKYPPPPPLPMTFYPDAHPETTSVDGFVGDDTLFQMWLEKIMSFGTTAYNANVELQIFIQASFDLDMWDNLTRIILLFDTSALPDDCSITDAKLYVYGSAKVDYLGMRPSLNVYTSAPASNTALTSFDYFSFGELPLCDTPITYANFKTGTPGDPNIFILNTDGIAAISKTGVTKLGLRDVRYDVGSRPPPWMAMQYTYLKTWSADKGGDYRPKLVVTYTE